MVNQSIAWPDNANCAAMITINLNAEFFWLGMFPDSINRPKTLSMGQYGMKRGLERVLNTLDYFAVKATFFIPGKVVEAYPEKVKEIINRGHEVGLLGYGHENYAGLSSENQRDSINKGLSAFKNICGLKPKGFRAPYGELTQNTMDLLMEFGFKYSSSLFGDDRPYLISSSKDAMLDIVEIPLHWELNDFPSFAFNYTPAFPSGQGRIANYTGVLSSWIDEYKAYYKYGLCYVAQFDPSTIGTPGRIKMLENLLEFIKNRGRVYFATGSEMAEFWRQNTR